MNACSDVTPTIVTFKSTHLLALFIYPLANSRRKKLFIPFFFSTYHRATKNLFLKILRMRYFVNSF